MWERGDAWGDSVTPSTFDPGYRAWIVDKLERCLDGAGGGSLLGVGCGNGIVEAELVRRGRSVLAIDALPQAVRLARRKGVDAIVADATRWQPPHDRWHVVYADGFLGHVYDRYAGCDAIVRRLRSWLAPRHGVLVISNDAPSETERARPATAVPGFYWLSAGYIGERLRSAGFEICETEEFVYERPLSGPRRRAVVTARG